MTWDFRSDCSCEGEVARVLGTVGVLGTLAGGSMFLLLVGMKGVETRV